MTNSTCFRPSDLAIYIFSFNRGQFLENAVKSAITCSPGARITVIDDNSSDSETREILRRLATQCDVIRADNKADGSNLLGGLYKNMRFAFHHALDNGHRLALFLQDDMQIVRPIQAADMASATRFFNANENSAQLQTTFMKTFLAARDEQYMTLDASGEAYLRPSNYPGYSGFSAVGLFNLDRFFALFDELRDREYDNNAFARQAGIQMGISTRPFMMYLPFPPSHRGRTRSIALRLVEWLGGTGFYPYEYMTADEVDSLLRRDKLKKPYAESWLNCPNLNHLGVWSFSGGLTKLRERGGWRKPLGEALTLLNRYRESR